MFNAVKLTTVTAACTLEMQMWLRERGVETVVIVGYMTQMCCDTTLGNSLYIAGRSRCSIRDISDL
jgi:nicotinamidase-related amidase